jgi:RimJ/RimL family protein N-acetyltransferase
MLETERLILRVQRASDVPALVDLWADTQVTRYLGGPRDRAWLQSEPGRPREIPTLSCMICGPSSRGSRDTW